ncbi:ClpP/crotonase-like domain-containing protein [Pelagophyceae sp. CCMP2097]|nr:ClpP/crotonase-like domain-containing protein [Pelagophyceae sp. CCMP2097]
MSGPAVQWAMRHGVAVVRISSPPVNALSKAVRVGLLQSLKQAMLDAPKGIVVMGDGRTFPAGADITEFGKGPIEPHFNAVMHAYEQCEVPTIAAIHGTALGGGFELALSCQMRVALKTAKVGFPEVHLGLLPGAGGTQRLPRLVGAENALSLILSGRHISAAEAVEMGCIDALVPDGAELEDEAIRIVSERKPGVFRKSCGVVMPAVGADVFSAARRRAPRGVMAPQLIVECVEAASKLPFEAGLAFEAAKFDALMAGPQSKALQMLFFAERACAKLPADVDAKAATDVRKVAVIGGGTMGRGIAMCFLDAGLPVSLVERDAAAATAAADGIEATYKRSSAFRSGALTEAALRTKLAQLWTTEDYAALGDVDVAIEAAFENLATKRDIFARLDEHMKPGAILATNTSTLSIDAIADAAASRPSSVVGMHFFSPANVMKLLENVRGPRTSDAAVATAMALGKKLGKVSILAKDSYGFIGNRLFEPYSFECFAMLDPAHSMKKVSSNVQSVDRALHAFGMAMGPFTLYDLAGNDIGALVRKARGPSSGSGAATVADALVAAGRLGQKAGRGWYAYAADAPRTPVADAAVDALIEAHFGAPSADTLLGEEVVERAVFAMANEGFRVLEERVAARPSDVDVVMVSGYGFPRHVGGPLHLAHHVGLRHVCESLDRFRADRATPCDYLEPCNLLRKMAAADARLEDWHKFL